MNAQALGYESQCPKILTYTNLTLHATPQPNRPIKIMALKKCIMKLSKKKKKKTMCINERKKISEDWSS